MIISGTELSLDIKNKLKNKLSLLEDLPCLSVILVGDRIESKTYVNMKKIACEYINMDFKLFSFPEDVTEIELISKIGELNSNKQVNGIIVQLPLPKHLDEGKIIENISDYKDVDCMKCNNIGKMMLKGRNSHFLPCTPKGVMKMLKNFDLESKDVIMVGRSNIVGIPLFHLLLQKNATVTICHSKTLNLPEKLKSADIVISAVGIPNFIKGEWLKPNCIAIDVGINKIEIEGKIKLVGDFDFESCINVASHISPVPGGVGPMTVAMLLKNTFSAYKLQKSNDSF